MPLGVGARLGPYEVRGPLGAGGMGEVYRARDTRLDRDVAIKVLSAGLAGDPDRRARFEREARAVAALSHPNILALYDVGEHDGEMYVVTEVLEGESLRERLAGGPLPIRKAIEAAAAIARGLAAAHDKQLVHRDLKPENVFLLKDGQVKILDFGLARTSAAADGVGATATGALTDPGTVMGTVGYMAPEQVRGQAVDGRTDLFALGAILYEMLSGRRAFQRDTAPETMTAILREDPPDLSAVRVELSPGLERIVRHCLEKNPAERFQTARDVAFALEALSGSGTGVASGAVTGVAPPRWWRTPAFVVLAAAVALTAGILIGRAQRPLPSMVTFETKTWASERIAMARFGPDGRTIVFDASASGAVPRLFVIRPDTITPQPFGPPATHLLSVSSKGELAVIVDARPLHHRLYRGTLARMTMDGAVRPWMRDVLEADWSPDGSTLAITRFAGAGMQLEYPIGHVLHRVTSGYVSDPRVAPDGRHVAFFEHQIAGDDRGWLKVVDAEGAVTTLAGEYWGEEGIVWSRDSRLVYFSASMRGGEAYQPLVVGASGTSAPRQALPSAGQLLVEDRSPDGRLLVMRDDRSASIRVRVPGASSEQEYPWLDFATDGFLSRDHTFLVFADQSQSAGADYAVALRRLDGGEAVRLGKGGTLPLSPDDKWVPALAPSTDRIVFYPTGPGETLELASGGVGHYQSWLQWFPDGRRVLVCGNEEGKPPRCYAQDFPNGAPTPVTPDNVTRALLAGDGRTMLLTTAADTFEIATIGGNAPPSPAKGLTVDDRPFAWTGDHRAVLVSRTADIPARVEQVDLATGRRRLVATLGPPDMRGVISIRPTQWLDDGRGYVYQYQRELSRLLVATGVRP